MKNLLLNQMITHHGRPARRVAIVLFAALLSAVPFQAAFAQTAPVLGTAANFAVLGGTAVTLTSSAVIGDVGSPIAVTLTTSTVVGTVYPAGDPIAVAAYNDFLNAYDNLALEPCGPFLLGNLAGQVLTPGVYCVAAASTTSDGTLTLDARNDPNAVWIFKIGTGGTGALTGTNFSVVMANGGQPCNVYWWVAEAATMNTSNFKGTILAGAATTLNYGSLIGRALANAAVTMTGPDVFACSSLVPPPIDKDHCKDYCKRYCKDHDKDHDKDQDHDKDHRDRK